MTPDMVTALQLLVGDADGSTIASPADLIADLRRLAETTGPIDGRPATGTGLVQLLARSTDELAAGGLYAVHTPERPGQPEWLAVTSTADQRWRRRSHRLPSLDVPGPLVDRIEAVARDLVADTGSWVGQVGDFRAGWARLSWSTRENTDGPKWPTSPDQIVGPLRSSAPWLARRGIAVTVGHEHVRINRTPACHVTTTGIRQNAR